MIPILEANVRKNKHLAATVAAALAVATLAGTSAFAETRHRQETQRSGNARETVRRERSARAQESARSDESRNSRRRESTERSEVTRRQSTFRPEGETSRRDTTRSRETYRRNESSSRGETYRRNESSSRGESYRRNDSSSRGESYRRNDSSSRGESYRRNGSSSRGGRNDSWRGNDNNRSYGNRGGYNNRSYGSSRPYYHRGAVTRYSRYGGGYRVWIAGAPYPFFVPLAHWRHDRFRVGLVINLGGWYRDGYYDYYDGYDYRATSRGDLVGVVESVDYGRDTFVVRNEATGSFVTVVARDRRARDVRPGDYVELSGSWTRNGVFSAYDVDYIDRDRDYRDRY